MKKIFFMTGVFLLTSLYSNAQKPKVQAKIIMVLDSISFQSKSISLALEITNLSDEDIYIPSVALRDTSGAYFTVRGNRRSQSYPKLISLQSVNSKNAIPFSHGNEVFIRSHGTQLTKILDVNAKQSFDIADEYSRIRYGKVNRDGNFYSSLVTAVYLKKYETKIINVLNPYTLYSSELGTGTITASLQLGSIEDNGYPDTVLNYKKYFPESLKILPLSWEWF